MGYGEGGGEKDVRCESEMWIGRLLHTPEPGIILAQTGD